MSAKLTELETGTWTDVCPVSDMIDSVGQCALLNGRQIALFYLADPQSEQPLLFALDNYDPFSAANVLSRGVVGDIQGRLVVASPVYKQHFDLATGQCLEDESVTLTSYPVRVVDGIVQVAC